MRRLLKLLFFSAIILIILLPLMFRGMATLRETEGLSDNLPTEGRLIETASGKIFIQELGPADGAPVLLAHGTAAWSGLWRETMVTLADQGYRAIAFDMPPFGYSERDPAGDYTRVTQAGRIINLVAALDIKPILAAHSFGASAGMEAALREPTAFNGLIIINGAIGLGATNHDLYWPVSSDFLRPYLVATTGTNPLLTKTFLRQLLYRKDQASDAHVAILQRPGKRTGSTQSFADWVPTLLTTPRDALSTVAESYQGFDLKTVLIWGDEDHVTPPEQAHALAKQITDSQLIMLPDVGHIPHIEDPDSFFPALLRALSSFNP